MASGLSMPVGFKNTTTGEISNVIQAMMGAMSPKSFRGLDQDGRSALVYTTGNPYVHLILRGASSPNYDAESVAVAQSLLLKKGLPGNVMIDCSHGNSQKDYRNQPAVFENTVGQVRDGNNGIIGFMLESNVNEGSQKYVAGQAPQYGVSITDSCINFETTKNLVMDAKSTLTRVSMVVK